MNNSRKHLKAALIVALGYGLSFVIGVVIINLVFDSGLLDSVVLPARSGVWYRVMPSLWKTGNDPLLEALLASDSALA
jgi:hypothetical protein